MPIGINARLGIEYVAVPSDDQGGGELQLPQRDKPVAVGADSHVVQRNAPAPSECDPNRKAVQSMEFASWPPIPSGGTRDRLLYVRHYSAGALKRLVA